MKILVKPSTRFLKEDHQFKVNFHEIFSKNKGSYQIIKFPYSAQDSRPLVAKDSNENKVFLLFNLILNNS